MADEFKYDVFLSHSAKDKDVVREIVDRLKSDGVRVWFDEWEIRPSDSTRATIADGLEHGLKAEYSRMKAESGAIHP